MKGMIKRKDSKMMDKKELNKYNELIEKWVLESDYVNIYEVVENSVKKLIEENPQIIQRIDKMKEILEKRKSNHSLED